MENSTQRIVEARDPVHYRAVLWPQLYERLTRQAAVPMVDGLAGQVDISTERLADLREQQRWQDFADKSAH